MPIKRSNFVNIVPIKEILITEGAKTCIGCKNNYENLSKSRVITAYRKDNPNIITYALCHEECENKLVNTLNTKNFIEYSHHELRFFEPDTKSCEVICDDGDNQFVKIKYKDKDEITRMHIEALGLN